MLASSPSGYETEAAAVFRKELSGFCSRVETDVMGNTMGILNPDAPFRVMLAGHYDEIGFQIVYITEDGLLYFRPNGGIDKLNIPSSEVEILTPRGRVPGVIGKKPIHLLTPEERNKALDLAGLWIDIGAASRKEAEALVSVGDPVALKSNFRFLNDSRIMSKGMDDKIGAFIVAETLRALSRRKLHVAVYGVGTVQEEVGTRGASACAEAIRPQVGFALDVGFATDIPNVAKTEYGDIRLGLGPMLCKSCDCNTVLGEKVRAAAKKHKIAWQESVAHRASGGTDACTIQLASGGVATMLLSIPNRYMHSQVEICDLRDAEGAVRILTETIASLKGTESFRPGLD